MHAPETGDCQAVAVAVIAREGSVLLVRRRADDDAPPWVLPGGKIWPGESAGRAAAREVLEETGLNVTARRVLGSRVHPATRKPITYVACDVIAGTARVAAPRELLDPTGRHMTGKWVGFRRDMSVNTGAWSLTLVDSSVDEAAYERWNREPE